MPRPHGPPPKPTELKRRLGNPGKRPLPAPIVALAPIVAAPLTLAPESGDALIDRLLDGPASAWIGEPDRLVLLSLVHDAWDRRAALAADIAAHGRTYRSESRVSGVQYHDRPEVRQLEHLEKQLTTWLSLLGLSPADRSRLGVAEVRARSKLEELADKRRRLGA